MRHSPMRFRGHGGSSALAIRSFNDLPLFLVSVTGATANCLGKAGFQAGQECSATCLWQIPSWMCSVFRSSAGARLCRIAEVRKSSRCYHGAVIRHIPEFGITPQVMRRDVFQTHLLATGLNHVPDHILRDALPPYLPRPGNCAKYSPLRNSRCPGPLVERRFDPLWNGDRADVPALADQIHYRPVPLADLDLTQLQANQFRSAKTTTK